MNEQSDIIDIIEEYLQLKEKNRTNNGLSSEECSKYFKLQKYIRDNITDVLSNGYTLIRPKKGDINITATSGYWIKDGERWGGMQSWRCSKCNHKYDIHYAYTKMPYHFCPNCGDPKQSDTGEQNSRINK